MKNNGGARGTSRSPEIFSTPAVLKLPDQKKASVHSAQGVLAATLTEPGHYEIRQYPFPDPAPGCLLVKMEVSGICGTDKHTYQGYIGQYGGRGLPRPVPFPIIQGHENVGTIVAIGEN